MLIILLCVSNLCIVELKNEPFFRFIPMRIKSFLTYGSKLFDDLHGDLNQTYLLFSWH